MKNFRIFHLKTFIFLVVKFIVYLNRRVLVMETDIMWLTFFSVFFFFCLRHFFLFQSEISFIGSPKDV